MMNAKHVRRIQHSLEWLFYFARFSSRQFYNQQGLQIASSLSYTSLLALVPLVTVMFTFLRGQPVFESLGNSLQVYIFNNFVPAFGESILAYISSFSQKASQLTITGLLMLFVVSLMMMATIDNALNSIWHVVNRRNSVARFLVYWAILTMGPLLLGVGLFSTTYLFSLPLLSGVDTGLGIKETLLAWLPFITTSTAFTLLYILIPNCFVLRRHAFVGGVIAAILFELAKYGFGIYVQAMPGFQTIYGTLAIIPIFLVWIYTSWVVVLMGAHISFCLSAFRLASEKLGRMSQDWSFEEVYQIIYLLWQAQKDGKSLSYIDMKKQGVITPQHQINEIMGHLHAANWVHATGSGRWILSRDMDDATLLDLHKSIPKPLSEDMLAGTRPANMYGLDSVLTRYQQSLIDNLTVPVSTLLKLKHEELEEKIIQS